MILRIFVSFIIIAAFIVGVLMLTLPREQVIKLIIFREFFETALPILAFGALIKYLCTCSKSGD